MRTASLALLGAALLTGCGTIYLDAPPGTKLLPGDVPTEVTAERSVYYYLWGARNFEGSDIHAASLVKEHGLKEARLSMTNTLVDGIISVPGAFVSIVRRTIRVEGNR